MTWLVFIIMKLYIKLLFCIIFWIMLNWKHLCYSNYSSHSSIQLAHMWVCFFFNPSKNKFSIYLCYSFLGRVENSLAFYVGWNELVMSVSGLLKIFQFIHFKHLVFLKWSFTTTLHKNYITEANNIWYTTRKKQRK